MCNGNVFPMLPPTKPQASAIGAALRAMRQEVELSLRDVAGRCGISAVTLSKYERGERVVSAETLARIARTIADEVAARRAA